MSGGCASKVDHTPLSHNEAQSTLHYGRVNSDSDSQGNEKPNPAGKLTTRKRATDFLCCLSDTITVPMMNWLTYKATRYYNVLY